MQRILTLTSQLVSGGASSVTLPLGQRRNTKVDRLQAFARPQATGAGAFPTEDQITAVELSIGIQLWMDQNQQDAIIPTPVPVNSIRFLDPWPVPIEPFVLDKNNQLTLQWTANNPNLWISTAFAAASRWDLYLVLWGTDDRKLG